MTNKILGFLIVTVVLFSSCKKEVRNLQEVEDDLIKEYLVKNNLISRFQRDFKIENQDTIYSGIYYEVLKEGKDSIKNADEIFYLQDIKVLDGDNIPGFNNMVTFSDSYSYITSRFGYIVPAGFKKGLEKAKLGGKVRAIIPSYLAYGKSGVGTQVKGNKILDIVFDVIDAKKAAIAEDSLIRRYLKTLPDVYDKDASGVYYSIVDSGAGAGVLLTSKIKAAYSGKLFNGIEFDSSTEAEPMDEYLSILIEGWQKVLPKIKNGGKIKLLIPPTLGYGKTSTGLIPPNTPLFFDIHLIEVN